jgi:hypothetical protein
MSSAGQATPPPPTSNVQFINDALADYAKEIGIDIFKNPFATMLERSNSLEAILQLLQGREKVFDEPQIVIAIFFEKRISRWQLETDQLPQPGSEGPPCILRYPWQGGEPGESRACHMVTLSMRPRQILFPPATVLLTGVNVSLRYVH